LKRSARSSSTRPVQAHRDLMLVGLRQGVLRRPVHHQAVPARHVRTRIVPNPALTGQLHRIVRRASLFAAKVDWLGLSPRQAENPARVAHGPAASLHSVLVPVPALAVDQIPALVRVPALAPSVPIAARQEKALLRRVRRARKAFRIIDRPRTSRIQTQPRALNARLVQTGSPNPAPAARANPRAAVAPSQAVSNLLVSLVSKASRAAKRGKLY
jgi:hypothetical protein